MKAKGLRTIFWSATSLGKVTVKFSGSLSLRRIPNETLKRDESFIEMVRGRREKRKLAARLEILRSTKFLPSPPENAKRLVSQCSVFSQFEAFRSGTKKKCEYVIYEKLN